MQLAMLLALASFGLLLAVASVGGQPLIDGILSSQPEADETQPLNYQVNVGQPLDHCWYECAMYGDTVCSTGGNTAQNPYAGQGRKLSQFEALQFANPIPDAPASSKTGGASFISGSGGSSSFLPKPIDEYTFEEKCMAVSQCRQIEGSGVPCGWCQTGVGFGQGFSSTCRKDGVGNCYPYDACPGVWTWQFFRCPTDNEFGCFQECKFHIKKCVNSNFGSWPEDDEVIVTEDFQYFPEWVNGNGLGR